MNNLKKEKITNKMVEAAKNGDEKVLTKILELMDKEFFKIAIIKLQNEDDAQDAIQETKISIYKNLNTLKETKYFKTWAIKILINECNKIYLERKRNLINIENMEENYHEEMQNVESKIYISDLMDKISEREKVIITLYANGYKSKEIAQILNINENTVKTKIRRTKEKLKKYSEEEKSNKWSKAMVIIVLIVAITSGLVYASIVMNNSNYEESEPIKWDTTNITIDSNEETIKKNMIQYDDETYILQVQDYNKLLEVTNLFNIKYLDNTNIDENIFKTYEYDLLFITYLKPKKLKVNCVLPYKDKVTIEFLEENEITKIEEYKNAFCIWIPKAYNRDNIEITYKKQTMEDMFPNAVRFRYSGFYVTNIDEFRKRNIKYDENKEYYIMEIFDINEYNSVVEKLGLKDIKKILSEEDLKGRKAIFIFRENKKRMGLHYFRVRENVVEVLIDETNEEYGNGISGMYIVFGTRFEDYNVTVKS